MPQDIKDKLTKLVDKYEKARQSGSLKSYTEEDTKNSFIKPLFEILGWDFSSKEEITSEESMSSGRVDHGFYLNGRIQFYLEAKKAVVDINKEELADQAIRYSWNKGATWAVLTNFEELVLFNAQDIENSLSDKQFFKIHYTKYIENIDQLLLLSKEAFQNNALDKQAEKWGKKIQKVSVTTVLYKDFQKCRELLTKDLKQCNEGVDNDLLDEGVQKLLDRLIFIRVAEDRGVEPPTLTPMYNDSISSGKQGTLYEKMVEKFRELDEVYNSNLFSPHPFEKWEEYSGVTGKVINILKGKKGYYEYDFKVMPADVLGTVYENYLAYKLSQGKRGVTVAKDSGKRKEQGIYYTPRFIVDYIVKNALGPVLDKCKSIDDLKKIKVLDPACGSGSFLIRAFELIKDKYKDFGYQNSEAVGIKILTDNIYGVDLDDQAVEITRLNLLISALSERMKLPKLENIKNGNSLIAGTDEELKKYFGPNWRDKKPFNWQDQFPEVFAQGGFDVVIGNPPYVFARGGNFDEQEKQYYYDHYQWSAYQLNTYMMFVERGYRLLKDGGNFGFIIPNNWLSINTFAKMRENILKQTGNVSIINASNNVFRQVSVDSSILLFTKTAPTTIKLAELQGEVVPQTIERKPDEFYVNDFVISIARSSGENNAILDKINRNCVLLGEITEVKSGLVAYEVGKGKPNQTEKMKDQRVYHSKEKKNDGWLKYLDGVDVKRYLLGWSGEYIKYGDNLSAPRQKRLFEGNRILIRQIPSNPPYCMNAVYMTEEYVNDRNSNNILDPKNGYDLKYILAIINSKLTSFWFVQTFNKFQRKIFPQFKVNELARFPLPSASDAKQKEVVIMVDRMLELQQKRALAAPNSDEWNRLKAEIEKTDAKIDAEVYKLYNLTPEEIKIIENPK